MVFANSTHRWESTNPVYWNECKILRRVRGYDIQGMVLAVSSLAYEWKLPPYRFSLALSAVVIGLTAGGSHVGP
jgi:hypothetical protein